MLPSATTISTLATSSSPSPPKYPAAPASPMAPATAMTARRSGSAPTKATAFSHAIKYRARPPGLARFMPIMSLRPYLLLVRHCPRTGLPRMHRTASLTLSRLAVMTSSRVAGASGPRGKDAPRPDGRAAAHCINITLSDRITFSNDRGQRLRCGFRNCPRGIPADSGHTRLEFFGATAHFSDLFPPSEKRHHRLPACF
jgi:hypothetical protein